MDTSVSPALIDDICSSDPVRIAAALQAAAPHRETLAPVLIGRMMEASFRPHLWNSKGGNPSPIFLGYLAAAWQLKEAHPLVLALLRLPAKQCDEVLGDFITEGAKQALADTWPGNISSIESLALDPQVYCYARATAIDALALLTARGTLPREDALAAFTRIAAAPFDPDNEDDVFIINTLVGAIMDLRAWELRGTIVQLFDRELVDPGYAGDEDEVLAKLKPGAIFDPTDPRFPPPITDAWAAVKSWAFFNPKFDRPLPSRPAPSEQSSPPAPSYSWEPPQPYLAPPKVGRNDPCPCGSGKKYKKCCGG